VPLDRGHVGGLFLGRIGYFFHENIVSADCGQHKF
jgi:hypothetical protein